MKHNSRVLWWVVGLLALAAFVLVACPTSAVVCPSFLKPCGQTCVDIQHDKANCGACGVSCASNQICVEATGGGGSCACESGSTLCGGACSVTSSDPDNCGGCADAGGAVCTPDQICEHGACRTACTVGGCDGGCADGGC